MFGFFKKKCPLLKEEMLTPVDEPISTTEAKRIFKQFMKDIGYLEKDELADHAGYLADEIKGHEQYLKEEVSDKKEEVAEFKRQIKEQNNSLKNADTAKKEDIQYEIDDLEDELVYSQKELEQATEVLSKFRKDKRAFLVEYINSQTQSW